MCESSADGILLNELNRLLRFNGYFVYSAPPAYKTDKDYPVIWDKLMNLTTAMCWRLIARKVQTAIWIKENNESCLLHNAEQKLIKICDPADDSKPSWNIQLKNCVQMRNSKTDPHKLPPSHERQSVFSNNLNMIGLSTLFCTCARLYFLVSIFNIFLNIKLYFPNLSTSDSLFVCLPMSLSLSHTHTHACAL